MLILLIIVACLIIFILFRPNVKVTGGGFKYYQTGREKKRKITNPRHNFDHTMFVAGDWIDLQKHFIIRLQSIKIDFITAE